MSTEDMINRLLDGEPLDQVLGNGKAESKKPGKQKSTYDIDEKVTVPVTGELGIVESYDDVADTYRLRDTNGEFLGVYEGVDLFEAEEPPPGEGELPPPGPPPVSNDSPFDRIKTEYAATMSVSTPQLIPLSNFLDDMYKKKPGSDWIVDGKPNPVILKKVQKYLDQESQDFG